MRGAGYRWVYGNIDPGNLASRRQAEAVGREVWFQAVRFREEGPEARQARSDRGGCGPSSRSR